MASEHPSIGFDHLVEPMQLDEEQHKEATRAKTTQKTTQHDQEIKKEMKRVSSPFLIVPICDSMRMPLQNGHRPKGTLLKKYRPAFLCFHPYNCIIQSSSFTRFSCCILAANKRVRPPTSLFSHVHFIYRFNSTLCRLLEIWKKNFVVDIWVDIFTR